MPIQPNKKVVGAIQSNKLTIKDVRTRPKYWNKPYGYYTECPNCKWKIVDDGYWKWPEDKKAKEKVWEYYGGQKCLRCDTVLKNRENEENYHDFICYTGWKWWNRNYKFLPLLDAYKKIKDKVVEELDGFKKDFRQECVKKFDNPGKEHETINKFQNENGRSKWDKGASFRLMPYFVIANSNNTITVITQNTRQLDFAKLDIAFFWRGNKWQNKAQTIKDKRLLYWCVGVSYINDKKATCVLTLVKDYMWAYYGNVMESRAKLNIFTSQLGNAHEEIERDKDGVITKIESYHKEDYNQSNEAYCRACDNCFDFCGDLRNKTCKYVGKNGYNVASSLMSWQPTFTIGMSLPGKPMGKVVIKGDSDGSQGGKILQVPNAIVLFENYQGNRNLSGFIPNASDQKPTLYYLLDGYHFDPIANKGVNEHGLSCKDPNTFSMYWPNNGENITKRINPEFPNGFYWDELPREYADQPHLLNHSSAQVYFQRKLLFTANWKHLLVRRKKSDKASGKRGISAQGLLFVLGYRMKINSSIAGILYNFESGDIFFKWELKVKGSYQNVGWLDWLIEKLFKMLGMGDEGENVSYLGGSYSAEEGEKKPGFVGAIRNLWILFKEAIKGWVKKQIGTDFNQVFDAERYQKMSGIDGSNTNDLQQTDSEAQTERMKKSTAKGQNRIVEPAIFYTNTIDLAYDFFEYGNRSMDNPFEVRAEGSKILHDNLYNNNNKNPIQQFNIRVRHLKQAITEGEWQAEVDMFDFDTTDGWWKRVAGGGTTFYRSIEEKEMNEFFPNWKPVFRVIQSATKGETGNAGGGQGQEEVDLEVKKGESKRNEAKSEDTVCEYDNRIIFIDKPKLVNSSGQNIVYDYLGQTPGWTGNEWPCDPSGWEYNWTLPQDTYTYKWKIWSGQNNEGVHVGVSEVKLTLTHPPGGGKGKGPGVVIMTLESSTPDITNMKFNFKEERIEFEKEEEYKETEYKEPDFSAGETELDADADPDDDQDREDMEVEMEEWGDRDAAEIEGDDDWDVDLDDKDEEQEDENEFELDDDDDDDSDDDQEDENEQEEEREDEQDTEQPEDDNDDQDRDDNG